jgi:hypothetical protein
MMEMMAVFRCLGGRRGHTLTNFIVAAFILASAAMPFAHHSLECHLKSVTHCAACTVGPGAKLSHDQAELVPALRRDAGPATAPSLAKHDSPAFPQTSGRAPPIVG